MTSIAERYLGQDEEEAVEDNTNDDEPLLLYNERPTNAYREYDRKYRDETLLYIENIKRPGRVLWALWGKRDPTLCYLNCPLCVLGFLGILFLTGSVVLFLSFRQIVDFIVTKSIVLEPGSQIYNAWKEPPLPIYFKVYVFNITNRDEFPWKTAKPVVEELGPYVYREHWKRVAIRFHDNDTVSFRKIKTFTFQPQLSSGTEEDMVTTINMPVLAAAYMFKSAGPIMRLAISSVFHLLHESFFIHRSIKELLFDGYDDPLIKVARDIFGTYPYTRFGYFYGKNGTDDGQFTVFTGKGVSSKFTEIDRWNGNTQTDIWTTEYCNIINGTDGASFPPLLEPDKDLEIFVSDICRSIRLDYHGPSELFGIPAFKYGSSKREMDNGTAVPGNECYCTGKCLNSGVFNVTLCKFGAPAFISYPHFYDADPSYLDVVDGLKPNESLHSSLFYVEPITGIPLKMQARFQVNAYLERIPRFSFFDQLTTMLFPLIWFEESAEVTDDVITLIKDSTQLPFYYGKVVTYVLLTMGVILGISCIMYFVVSRKQDHSSKAVGPK